MTDNNYYKYQLIFFHKINSLDIFKSYFTSKLLYHEIINEINNSSSEIIFNNLELLDLFIIKFNVLKNISQNIYVFFKLLHIILDINNNIQTSLNNEHIKNTLKISLSENSNKSIENNIDLSAENSENNEPYQNLYKKLIKIDKLYQNLYSLSTKYENYNYNINIIYEKIKTKDINEFINIPFNLKPIKEYLKNNDNKQNILTVFNISKEIIKNILDIKQLKIDLKNYYNYTFKILKKYLSYLNTIKDTIQIPDIVKNSIIIDIENINIKRDIWLNRINKYYDIIYNSIISNKLELIKNDNTKENTKENAKENANNIFKLISETNIKSEITNDSETNNKSEINIIQINKQLKPKNNLIKPLINKQEPNIEQKFNQMPIKKKPEIINIQKNIQIKKELDINNNQEINQIPIKKKLEIINIQNNN